jgi:homospermidine synthase
MQFIFIGCGAVGFCLLELIKKEKLFTSSKFIIFEPRDIPDLEIIMKNYTYVHLREHITKENYREKLAFLNSNSFLVNVAVNVDSVMLFKFCVEKQSHYIDTSLEVYEDYMTVPPTEVTNYAQIMKNNLFHQNYLALRSGDKITRHISSGMNPGGISHFAKKALKEYARQVKGMKFTKKNWKGNYGELAHSLGLKEIQVVEYDSQKLKPKSSPSLFVNTWSANGFQEEAGDLVMLSLNPEAKAYFENKNLRLIQPTEEKSNIYFLNARGMNMSRKSVTLNYEGEPFEYEGMLIPHAETITMSKFFEFQPETGGGVSPTISYIYSPCKEAKKGLEFFRQNNYKNLPFDKVVRRKEIESGWDSIGALLHFENGDKFGGWTVCGLEDVKKHNLLSGPTTLQVACYLLPCILYTLQNRKSGTLNAEQVPHKYIFDFANKYLGKIFFKKV